MVGKKQLATRAKTAQSNFTDTVSVNLNTPHPSLSNLRLVFFCVAQNGS